MFERFIKITETISNGNNPLEFLGSAEPGKNNHYFIRFEKKEGSRFCQYRVYRAYGPKQINVDIDLMKQRVWHSLIIGSSKKYDLDCITSQMESFREEVWIDEEMPLISWISTTIPEVYGFK